jgi:glycosyltransferase involved in cell wall biosynthesis
MMQNKTSTPNDVTTARVAIVIPALNEAKSIGSVIAHIPPKFRNIVIVADNGSTDGTADAARNAGAHVTFASRRGYGSACLAGIKYAKSFKPEIVVFLDADFSDFPEDMENLVRALDEKELDLVIGSRTLGMAESGALLPQARFGNWLATRLMYLRYGFLFSDLGPFRAIRISALEKLEMRDKDFGWTVEMQIKALREGLRVGEVPVRYRKRIGVSKITGTVKGTLSAGIKILWTIGRYGIRA